MVKTKGEKPMNGSDATPEVEETKSPVGRLVMIQYNGAEVSRRDLIRDWFENGNESLGIEPGNRGQIVKGLAKIGYEVTFQIVFAATKGQAATGAGRASKTITLPDGETVKRADYIEECLRSGMSRQAIVRHFKDDLNEEVAYGIVFQISKRLLDTDPAFELAKEPKAEPKPKKAKAPKAEAASDETEDEGDEDAPAFEDENEDSDDSLLP